MVFRPRDEKKSCVNKWLSLVSTSESRKQVEVFSEKEKYHDECS